MIHQINGRRFELTDREDQCLKLIAEGKMNKEIAAELDLSIKTVEKHRQAVLDKSGIHSVAGLVHYALSRGLVRNQFAEVKG